MGYRRTNYIKRDEYFTPRYAIEPLLPYLVAGATIYCPFDTKESNFVKVFTEKGFKVIYGDITEGKDFFIEAIPECDYIISNPPYSLKADIFSKLNDSGKKWAMLVNADGLFDNKKIFQTFCNEDFELMFLYPRVRYIHKGQTGENIPFQSAYLCQGVLPKPHMLKFVERKDERQLSLLEEKC